MQRKTHLTAAFVLSALVALTATNGYAIQIAPPQTINYQGTLATAGKTPVTATVSMVFSLYATDTDASVLWREIQPSVSVSKGVYSVILGSTTPIALPFNTPYYLGVAVGTDAEMTPRLALTSSPYAFNVVNGAITNLGISASAAIADSKLAPIASAGKVSGSALTGLASVPSGAGALPVANGGTGAGTLTGYVKGSGTGAFTASSTVPASDISGTVPAAQLPAMVGDSGAGGTRGAVPAPAAGDAAAGKYLKADGTWTAPASGGGGGSSLVVVTATNGSGAPTGTFSVACTGGKYVVGGGCKTNQPNNDITFSYPVNSGTKYDTWRCDWSSSGGSTYTLYAICMP